MKIVIKTNELLKIEKLLDFCKAEDIEINTKIPKIENYSVLKNKIKNLQNTMEQIKEKRHNIECKIHDLEELAIEAETGLKIFENELKQSLEKNLKL